MAINKVVFDALRDVNSESISGSTVYKINGESIHINKVVLGSNTLIDITDTTATAGKIASGYTAYGANGVKVVGTLEQEVNNLEVGGATVEGTAAIFDEGGGSGGAISISDIPNSTGTTGAITGTVPSYGTKTISQNGTYNASTDGYDGFSSVTVNVSGGGTPSQTQHTIYFEFSDSTDTTITAYWDGTFISDAITATSPTTYGQKTVTLAQLDGVTWYPSSQETFEVLFNDYKTPNADTPYNYFWFETLGSVYPTIGSVWRITVDNTEYRCVAYEMTITGVGTIVCIGNGKYTTGGSDNGSLAPFNLYNAGWGALVGDTELTDVSHLIKIERLVTT